MSFRMISRTALLLLVCTWAWSGCSKQESAHQQQEHASEAHDGSHATEAPATGTAHPGEATATGAEVTLAGTLGCGHCNYHVTPECSPCIQTAAGEVYVIDGAGEGSELMEKRFDGLQIAVVGTVVEDGEAKHVAMTSFEWK